MLTLSDQPAWQDEREFAEIGRKLADGMGYQAGSYAANPGLPVYLATVFRIFGENYTAARFGQAIMGALTCVLLYQVTATLVSRTAGILAGMLLALHLPHIYMAGVFYVDALATFLTMLALYLALRSARNSSTPGLACLAGMSLGLAVLTRSVFLVWIPPMIAAWWMAGSGSARRRTACTLAFLAGAAVIVAPWTLRNYAKYDRLLLVSSGLYLKLWQGNNEVAVGDETDRNLFWTGGEWQARVERLPIAERQRVTEKYAKLTELVVTREREVGDHYLALDDVLRPVAIELVTADPVRTLGLMSMKVRTLFSAFTATQTQGAHTTRRYKLLAALSLYPLLGLALLGAVIGLRKRPAETGVVYLLVGTLVAAYALLTSCTRFRFPLDPYLIMFAALALDAMWNWVRRPTAASSPTGQTAGG